MKPLRFRSLDVLRGISILGMAWAGMLPDSLPAWMFHAQSPPPNHDSAQNIFGITWVDLVFPFFLFSMGAAIPIAISNRQKKGESHLKIGLWLTGRALLLAGFAVFGEHMRPFDWSASPDAGTWTLTIFFFGLLVLMFARWPDWMPPLLGKVLTYGSWGLATLLIAFHTYPDGNRGFENSRNDIILMVLANVAFSGGLIWLATCAKPLVRMGVIGAITLIFVNQAVPNSFAGQIWNFTPLQYLDLDHWKYSRFFPIFYHFLYHKYLLIVLPGTFCGDLFLAAQEGETESGDWSRLKTGTIALISLSVVVVAVIGLFARAVIETSWILVAISLILIYSTQRTTGAIEALVAKMIRFGFGFLFVGLIAEPMEGGIRKDSTTLSYFLVSAGLAFFMIATLEIIVDLVKEKRVTKFLWLAGMNPILAYAAITNLVMGLSGLTGYSDRLGAGYLASSPWLLAIFDGGMKTLLVGLVAATFTRWKIFLRA